MKLKVKIGDLVDAATQVSATLDRSDQATSNIYLRATTKDGGKVFLYTTNLKAETLTKIGAEVTEEGQILVNPDQLIGGLTGRTREDSVELSADANGKKLQVQYDGVSKFQVAADPAVEQMSKQLALLPFTVEPSYTFTASRLQGFIRRGMFCILQDKTGQNDVMGALHLTDDSEGYQSFASDGKIAARMQVKADVNGKKLGSVNLPLTSLQPLNRILSHCGKDDDVQVIKSENKVFFRVGDTLYGTTQLAGNYPNLQTIIESHKPKARFRVNREALKGALTRANVFRSLKTGAIELELKKDKLSIKAKSDATGALTDTVSVTVEAESEEPIKMGLGLDYLTNIVGSSHAGELSMGMKSAVDPLIVNDPEEDVATKYVLMGVKIKE